MRVTESEMLQIAELVEDLCGIVLDQTKGYLVENRLGDMLSRTGCGDYSELVERVRAGEDDWLRSSVINSITTQETLFFRDQSPFDALRHKVLPEIFDSKERASGPSRLRVWCAACSTGQEPYSVAMVLQELLGNFTGWDLEILGTDISDTALMQASAGVFGDLEVRRGLSTDELNRNFIRDGDSWKVKPHLREIVRFERRNLLDSFATLGEFDIIFCRNVAIYFRPEARRDLYRRLVTKLEPGGHLFTSSSESLRDVDPCFRPELHCRSVFYRPNLI